MNKNEKRQDEFVYNNKGNFYNLALDENTSYLVYELLLFSNDFVKKTISKELIENYSSLGELQ